MDMRTILLFLFFGWLAVLMYCLEAARWVIARTEPQLIRRLPQVPGGILARRTSLDNDYLRF